VAVVDLHEKPPRSHVARVHDACAPRLQRNERPPFPIDARKDDPSCRYGADGLAIFGREVDALVKASTVVAWLTEAARDDPWIPVERAHQLEATDVAHCVYAGLSVAVEQTPTRRQDPIFGSGVSHPVTPHEVRDRVAVWNGLKGMIDVRALLFEHTEKGRGETEA